MVFIDRVIIVRGEIKMGFLLRNLIEYQESQILRTKVTIVSDIICGLIKMIAPGEFIWIRISITITSILNIMFIYKNINGHFIHISWLMCYGHMVHIVWTISFGAYQIVH